MEIMTGLAALNAALEAVKTIRDVEKDFDKSQYKVLIADLNSNLADAKISLSELLSENYDLKKKILELKASQAFGSDLFEHKGYKYRKSESGKPTGMPFCSVCEVNEGKYFQLTRSKGLIEFTCPNCKSVFHHVTSFT